MHAEVKRILGSYPDAMVHDSAASVISEKQLMPAELAWLLASFELSRPRVITRNVTDNLATRDVVS
jgi:hypothetical protein